MRRKAQPVSTVASAPPRVLLLGRCIEVWSDEGNAGNAYTGWRNHSQARRAWLESVGVPSSDHCRVVPLQGPPYSVAYMASNGKTKEAAERLSRVGADLADIPRLRSEALDLMEALKLFPDRCR